MSSLLQLESCVVQSAAGALLVPLQFCWTELDLDQRLAVRKGADGPS